MAITHKQTFKELPFACKEQYFQDLLHRNLFSISLSNVPSQLFSGYMQLL